MVEDPRGPRECGKFEDPRYSSAWGRPKRPNSTKCTDLYTSLNLALFHFASSLPPRALTFSEAPPEMDDEGRALPGLGVPSRSCAMTGRRGSRGGQRTSDLVGMARVGEERLTRGTLLFTLCLSMVSRAPTPTPMDPRHRARASRGMTAPRASSPPMGFCPRDRTTLPSLRSSTHHPATPRTPRRRPPTVVSHRRCTRWPRHMSGPATSRGPAQTRYPV